MPKPLLAALLALSILIPTTAALSAVAGAAAAAMAAQPAQPAQPEQPEQPEQPTQLTQLTQLTQPTQPSDPPVAPGPQDRVLFVPDVGQTDFPPEVGIGVGPLSDGPSWEAPAQDTWRALWPQQGLSAQNAGTRDTVLLALYGDDRDVFGRVDGCAGCNVVAALCSQPVRPGDAWRLPPYVEVTDTRRTTHTVGVLATVYSINTRPAREYGPDWVALMRSRELDPDATLAEYVCDVFNAALHTPGRHVAEPRVALDDPPPLPAAGLAAGCDLIRSFHASYLTDAPFVVERELPFAPFRGEPVGGVPSVVRLVGRPPEQVGYALDRYRAVPLSETGTEVTATAGVSHAYLAPGVHHATLDGLDSDLVLQNVGLGCATARLEAFESFRGPVGEPLTVTLAPGRRLPVHLAGHWPITETAAVRVESDLPLAATIATRGFDTSATHTAVRARPGPVTWAVPLAYQEEREGAAARWARPLAAEGWETSVAAFNALPEFRQLSVATQAVGQRERSIGIPVAPLQQAILQLGFGLGLPGGPGWARLAAEEEAWAIALESLREASDGPAFVEAWSATAWPRESGAPVPRTIALPELGLAAAVSPTLAAAVSPTLAEAGEPASAWRTRIAIQNLGQSTAEVAVDGYADCGYTGTFSRTIDARQTIVLAADELPGAAIGANAALLRVLRGDVAALTEIARPGRFRYEDAPPDLTNAYLGAPIRDPLPVPAFATATLAVTPTAVTIRIDETPFPEVAVYNADGAPRCMEWRASSDVPWLTAVPGRGPLPGSFALAVDRAQLGEGPAHEGVLTVAVEHPGIVDSPQHVRVTLHERDDSWVIHLPLALQWEVLRPEQGAIIR